MLLTNFLPDHCCGGRTRTCDLQVMSLRATNCSTPRYNQLISELRVQRYDFFPTPPNILSEICIYLTVIKQNSNKTYIKEAKTSKKQARLLFSEQSGLMEKELLFQKFHYLLEISLSTLLTVMITAIP